MATHHTTILFVDDDTDDRELFFYAITKSPNTLNAEVITFAGAIQFLNYLGKANPGENTIIFLDINMPLMSGLECLKELRKTDKYNHLPVVMFTTSSSEKDMREARELGADMYIRKPSTINDLILIIENVVDKLNNGRSGGFTLTGV